MKFKMNARTISRQAIIAALYAVITMSGFGLSYGPVQFRYSELMTWLAFWDPKNIIGLSVGCFIANITSPDGIIDMVVGTTGTLLATLLMARSKTKLVASVWPAFFAFLYSGQALFLGEITSDIYLLVTGQIMLSQFIIVGVIGIPVAILLERNKTVMDLIVDRTMLPTKETWTGQTEPTRDYQEKPRWSEK